MSTFLLIFLTIVLGVALFGAFAAVTFGVMASKRRTGHHGPRARGGRRPKRR